MSFLARFTARGASSIGAVLLAATAACSAPDTLAPNVIRAEKATVPATPDTIRLGYFTKSAASLVAQSQGFFAAENLVVQELAVQNSVQQFQFLRDDKYDMLVTSPDNVVNYRFNQNNALGAPLGVTIVFGIDRGMGVSLIARPGITNIEDLRGKTIAVDAVNSGFGYVLYALLQQHGLTKDVDYKVIAAGGTPTRYASLTAGKFDATLLNGGFDVRAVDAGYVRLGGAPDVASPYLGTVAAAKDSWLATHKDVAVRFTRAYLKALAFATTPANRETVVAALQTLPTTSRDLAEKIYATQVSPELGLIANGEVERKGLFNVMDLRSQFGGFDTEQNISWLNSSASGLFDLSVYRDARNDK